MNDKQIDANAKADKILIDSLYKKISALQIDVDNKQKYIDALEAQNRQIAFAPTKKQLNAMQKIIKMHTEV